MNQQDDGSAGGPRPGPDADAWRVLLVGLLEKVDRLAAGLLGDEPASQAPGRSQDPAAAGTAAGDFSAQIRSTLEVIVEEAGELLWQMLGQLIAILEAIQQALEQVMGSPPGTTTTATYTGSGASAHRDHVYEPITVHFESPTDSPTGDR